MRLFPIDVCVLHSSPPPPLPILGYHVFALNDWGPRRLRRPLHIINLTKAVEMHAVDDHTVWGAGEGAQTIPGAQHTVREATDYWGCVTVWEAGTWKNRLLTANVVPSRAAGVAIPPTLRGLS
jgi:hypothetical protein